MALKTCPFIIYTLSLLIIFHFSSFPYSNCCCCMLDEYSFNLFWRIIRSMQTVEVIELDRCDTCFSRILLYGVSSEQLRDFKSFLSISRLFCKCSFNILTDKLLLINCGIRYAKFGQFFQFHCLSDHKSHSLLTFIILQVD